MKRWKKTKDLLFQIYWEQFVLPINFIVFHIKFNLIHVHKRSTKILITSKPKRIDTKGEMERLEIGRDNMANYLNSIPDECIIDLSNKVYCTGR